MDKNYIEETKKKFIDLIEKTNCSGWEIFGNKDKHEVAFALSGLNDPNKDSYAEYTIFEFTDREIKMEDGEFNCKTDKELIDAIFEFAENNNYEIVYEDCEYICIPKKVADRIKGRVKKNKNNIENDHKDDDSDSESCNLYTSDDNRYNNDYNSNNNNYNSYDYSASSYDPSDDDDWWTTSPDNNNSFVNLLFDDDDVLFATGIL